MKRRHEKAITVAITALLVLTGLAVMCYPRLTDARYALAQWRLGASVAAASEAADGIALPDGAVARIEIPAIGVEAWVVEGTDTDALAEGPGHYPGTPLPGEPGNAAIASHRTMYGHAFHDLDQLEPGDEIVTGTATRRSTYRVVEVRVVDPARVDVVAPTTDNRLTLTTCHPIGSAAQRLVVVAELTD
jgi:sortase A